MYAKIEPSGVCEFKGKVQVRICFYLDPADIGYSKHHVQVPDFTGATYIGSMNEDGSPTSQTDYTAWVASLPKVWQNNPFHNHFIYVEPETADTEIADIGKTFLVEAYMKWSKDKPLDLRNAPVNFFSVVSSELKQACEARVSSINILAEVIT